MKNIILILSLIAFSITTSNAQILSDSIPAKTIIKWSPLSLISLVAPAAQFGIERQFAKNWTHQHELGILWDGNNLYDGNFFGVRLQNEIRFYIPRDKNSFDFFFDRYLSLQLTGNHLNYRDEEVRIWRNDDDGGFNQLLSLDANYNEIGVYLGTGKVVRFEKVPIMFEYGSAIGVRFIDRYFYNLPEDTENLTNNDSAFVIDPLDRSLRINPLLGFNVYLKVGYILN